MDKEKPRRMTRSQEWGAHRKQFFCPSLYLTTDFSKVKYVYLFDSIGQRTCKSLCCIVSHFEFTISESRVKTGVARSALRKQATDAGFGVPLSENARPKPSLSYTPLVFPHPLGEGDGEDRLGTAAQTNLRGLGLFTCQAGVPRRVQRNPLSP